MVKDILKSNMQLRDDLLKLSQEKESLQLTNYQVNVENEDMRD